MKKKQPDEEIEEEKVVAFKPTLVHKGLEGGPTVGNWLQNLDEGAMFWAAEVKYGDNWDIARKFKIIKHFELVTVLRAYMIQMPEGVTLEVISDRFCQKYKLLEVI